MPPGWGEFMTTGGGSRNHEIPVRPNDGKKRRERIVADSHCRPQSCLMLLLKIFRPQARRSLPLDASPFFLDIRQCRLLC